MKFIKYLTLLVFLFHFSAQAMNAVDKSSWPVIRDGMTQQDLLRFAKIGGGYAPVPEELIPLLKPILATARELPSGERRHLEPYIPNRSYETTYGKDFDELMLHGGEAWAERLPPESIAVINGMQDIAAFVIQNILTALELEKDFEPIVNELNSREANYTIKLIHHDPRRHKGGRAAHKDARLITVLYSEEEGLHGWDSNSRCYVNVEPRKGYFFVILGEHFETLVKHPKLTALYHCVMEPKEDRAAFGLFVESKIK